MVFDNVSSNIQSTSPAESNNKIENEKTEIPIFDISGPQFISSPTEVEFPSEYHAKEIWWHGGDLTTRIFGYPLPEESIASEINDDNLNNIIENPKTQADLDRELVEAAKENVKDENEETENNAKIYELLLQGANPNAIDEDCFNYIPLHWAAAYGKLAIVKLLLESKANINAQALCGHGNPLNVSRANPNNQPMQNFLIDYQNKIDRELIEAVKIGNVDKVVTLVRKGANPNCTDGCYFY